MVSAKDLFKDSKLVAGIKFRYNREVYISEAPAVYTAENLCFLPVKSQNIRLLMPQSMFGELELVLD